VVKDLSTQFWRKFDFTSNSSFCVQENGRFPCWYLILHSETTRLFHDATDDLIVILQFICNGGSSKHLLQLTQGGATVSIYETLSTVEPYHSSETASSNQPIPLARNTPLGFVNEFQHYGHWLWVKTLPALTRGMAQFLNHLLECRISF